MEIYMYKYGETERERERERERNRRLSFSPIRTGVQNEKRKKYSTSQNQKLFKKLQKKFPNKLPAFQCTFHNNIMSMVTNAKESLTMTSGLYYKTFMIVNYDCNDRGQYYKTTIMIVFTILAKATAKASLS
jgi:hypothetical protein